MNFTTRLLAAAAMFTALPAFSAELQDGPPVDAAQILDLLTKLKLQQQAAMKQRRSPRLKP